MNSKTKLSTINQRQELMDRVLEQIKKDVAVGDMTAIELMLTKLPTKILYHYLPE